MGVGPKIAIAKILVDLNLVIRYRISIRLYASKKYWRILIWQLHRQTAKPPNLIPRQIIWLYGSYTVVIQLNTVAYDVTITVYTFLQMFKLNQS